jgi:hypothetical protein
MILADPATQILLVREHTERLSPPPRRRRIRRLVPRLTA